MCANAFWGKKMVVNSLELELEAVLTHSVWRLGTKLVSSAKAHCLLNHPATSPAAEDNNSKTHTIG